MLVNAKVHLNFFADAGAIEEQIEALRNRGQSRCGLVSAELPLLSNLSLLQNCALILQYHQRFSAPQAQTRVETLLAVFGLQAKGNLRSAHLSEKDIFIAKLVRAVLFEPAIVIVDRPSEQLHADYNISDIIATVNKLAEHFAVCHILEYQHEERRHGPRRDR